MVYLEFFHWACIRSTPRLFRNGFYLNNIMFFEKNLL